MGFWRQMIWPAPRYTRAWAAPLMVDGSLMGALTADAVDPHAFEALEDRFLEALGALATATFRTTLLIEKVEETARERLELYAWPGNVRELEHVLMRATLKASRGSPHGEVEEIQPHHLGDDIARGPAPPHPSTAEIEDPQRPAPPSKPRDVHAKAAGS